MAHWQEFKKLLNRCLGLSVLDSVAEHSTDPALVDANSAWGKTDSGCMTPKIMGMDASMSPPVASAACSVSSWDIGREPIPLRELEAAISVPLPGPPPGVDLLCAGNRARLDDEAVAIRLEDGTLLAVLVDGASGGGQGWIAARLCIHGVLRRIQSRPTATYLETVLQEVDAEVAMHALYSDTTCVVVAIHAGSVLCNGQGDSEAYMMDPTEVDPNSQSPGWIQLTDRVQRKPRVGSGRVCRTHPPDWRSITGTIVLGSDGVFGLFRPTIPEVLKAVADHPVQTARAISNLVMQGRGAYPDDFSMVVVPYPFENS